MQPLSSLEQFLKRETATYDIDQNSIDDIDKLKTICAVYWVDITGGEPPTTYQNTIRLGLEDDRIHSLILGYWHTIVTPPMVFARNMVEVKKEMEAKGFVKPIVASLAGDVEVEEAAEYLYQNGIPAYAYSTELPVEVLGAKYKWARGAGLL